MGVNNINDEEIKLINELVKIRKSKGLTQKEVASVSGLSQQMVSRIENMDNSPTLSIFFKYIKAVGVDLVIYR